MAKILIIKRISDDFDEFVCNSLRSSFNNVDVYDAFRWHGKLGRKIVNKAKTMNCNLFFERCLNSKMRDIKKYDKVILFDDYPDIRLIQWIRKYNPLCKIKLWFWNVPNYDVEIYREYCQLYCFDQNYSKEKRVHFINQFYFSKVAELKMQQQIDIKYDVSYIGVDKGRIQILSEIADKLEAKNIYYKFMLVTKNKIDNKSITQMENPISYSDVVTICCESKAILELVHKTQKGLTWRSLEALFFKKKLITNNREIVKYDLYNKDNIFIYGQDNLDDLYEFLNSKFVDIPRYIVQKYTVDNWLQSILKV